MTICAVLLESGFMAAVVPAKLRGADHAKAPSTGGRKEEAPPDGGHWAGLLRFLVGGTLVMGEGSAPSQPYE